MCVCPSLIWTARRLTHTQNSYHLFTSPPSTFILCHSPPPHPRDRVVGRSVPVPQRPDGEHEDGVCTRPRLTWVHRTPERQQRHHADVRVDQQRQVHLGPRRRLRQQRELCAALRTACRYTPSIHTKESVSRYSCTSIHEGSCRSHAIP